jgi:CHAT domain-containing protein/tetratricopeptide (TPR) repeat protein
MLQLRTLPKTLAIVACALTLVVNFAARSQTPPASSQSYLPPEAQIADPNINSILDSAPKAVELGHYEEYLPLLQKALEVASKKQSHSDAAIIEDRIAVYYFIQGKLDDAKTYLLKSLSDATSSSNLVVQADVLVRLSVLQQAGGELDQALKTVEQALVISKQCKSLYIESQALGEQGRLQLLNHKTAEARSSIEEALKIDHANQYVWEPEHLLYLATVNVVESNKDKAIELGGEARDLAIKEEDYIDFIQASQFLGQGYVFTGQTEKGIRILELSRQGISEQGKQQFQHPDQFIHFVSLPYEKVTYLEALGTAYEAAQRIDDAVKTWQELFDTATAAGFTLARAESAQRLADLYKRTHDAQKSIDFYSIAAEASAAAGDRTHELAALRAEENQLYQSGQKAPALEIEEKLLSMAKASGDTQSRFLNDLIIAELLDSTTQTDHAQAVLEDADSLVDLSGAVTGTKPGLVEELYTRLAVIYIKRQDAQRELIAIEKAIPPAISLANAQGDEKNTKPLATLVPALEKQINENHFREMADKLYAEGKFAEALPCFEILRYYDETDAAWNNKYKEYISALGSDPTAIKLNQIPSKVIAQDDGPAILAGNIDAMGPIAEAVRLLILGNLVGYYASHQRPEMVIKYATEALSFIPNSNDVPPTPFSNALYCILANAQMQQKDFKSAVDSARTCLASAEKLGDPKLLFSAHQTNSFVLDAAGRHDEAETSEAYVQTHSPTDPGPLIQLAWSLSEKGDYAAALDAMNKAVELYHAARESKGEADTRVSIATLPGGVTVLPPEQRLTHLKIADTLYRAVGSDEGRVTAETYQAVQYASKGDEAKSHELFQGALKLARDIKKQTLEAFVFSQMALAAATAHDLTHAIEYYREAAKLYHEQGDLSQEAMQLKGVADALKESHDLAKALQEILRARSAADQSGNYASRYLVRTTLAWIYVSLGQFDDGISVFREAKQIADDANQPLLSAGASLGIAQTVSTVGNWEDAYDEVNAAIPVFERFNDTYDQYLAYTMLMEIYGSRESDRNDYRKALEFYQQAGQAALKANLGQAANANLDLAMIEVLYTNGQFKDAIAKAQEAAEYFKNNKNEEVEANALLSLSEAERSDGDLEAAANSFRLAEPLVEKSKDFYTAGRLHYAQANLYRQEGKLREAIEQYEVVINMIEEFKAGTNIEEVRHVGESYGYIYEDLIETYYSLAQADKTSANQAAEKALEYTELNKARAFSISWGAAFIEGLRRTVPGALQEKESTINSDRVALQSQLQGEAMMAGGRATKHVNQELEALRKTEDEFENQLRITSPAYAEVRYPEQISIPQIPLRSGELLVELKMLKGSTLVWLIEGDEKGASLAAFYKVDRPKAWFAERILRIRDAFNAGHPEEFDPAVTDELLSALFPESALQRVKAAKSIIIVPDDLFFLFPFEMLSSNGRYIFLNKPIEYFPSAGALRLARTAIHTTGNRQESFIGVADPITSADDPRYEAASLSANSTVQGGNQGAGSESVDRIARRGYALERIPATAAEVQGIVSLFPSSEASTKTLIGLDATKEQLLHTDLAQYDFIHFATHGILPVESGIKEPALVLSYDGQGRDDMLLTLSEILGFKLHANLVVLSACNTGSGKVTRAEGVASLGSAFLAAGSTSVVMSLWQVSDESTALLMKELYKNLLSGKSKVESLAAAREEIYSKGYKSPFFWAPFVLTGE